MTKSRTVEDGIETDTIAPLKVTRYIPDRENGKSHMHMTATHGTWKNKAKKLHGSMYVPMGSMNVVVSVHHDGKKDEAPDLFTFDAQDMLALAVKMFLGEES